MLIESHRHRPEDLAHWRDIVEPMHAVTSVRLGSRLDSRVRAAKAEILDFIARGDGGYLGTSWGKDSIVCAWLVSEIEREHGIVIPVVWVRLSALQNPDSYAVRDAFCARWGLSEYAEIEVDEGETRSGTKEERLVHGFAEAARRYGDRYISGVRASESRSRRMSIGVHGLATNRVCRPIGRWSVDEVFALAYRERLPLHPAYGYTMGGLLDWRHLRVANIGGVRGQGHGRAEWEREYYPEVATPRNP